MKKQTTRVNPYAAGSLQPIAAPHKNENEPKSTVTKGDDLRAKKKQR